MGKLRVRCRPRGIVDPGRWIYLDALGDVSGLKYSRVWRPEGGYSGPHMASWRWAYDPRVTPGFIRRGAHVQIVDDGFVCWGGMLSEPRRGTPHELTAYGYGREASGRIAKDERGGPDGTSLAPSFTPDFAVDHEIAKRALPWTRLGSLGDPIPRTEGQKAALLLTELLDLAAAAKAKVWHVDEFSVARLLSNIGEAYGAKPPIGLLPGDDVRMGTADPNYVSSILGYYSWDPDSHAGSDTWDVLGGATDQQAEERWGVQEVLVDYRAWGPLTDIQTLDVHLDAAKRLELVGARMQFTDTVSGNVDSLRRLGFGPQRVTGIREGETLRIFDALDSTGTLHLGASTDVTIGEVEVDADSMTATIKPVGFTPRDFAGILADPTEPRLDHRGRVITG